MFLAVTVLDDSETSIHRTDSPPKLSSHGERVSQRPSKALQTIRDSFDLDESEKSAVSIHSSTNQSSLSHESLSNDESAVSEIEKSTSNLHLECGHDELETQLLKRCGQSHVLAFNEIYSARYNIQFVFCFKFFLFSFLQFLSHIFLHAQAFAKV